MIIIFAVFGHEPKFAPCTHSRERERETEKLYNGINATHEYYPFSVHNMSELLRVRKSLPSVSACE